MSKEKQMSEGYGLGDICNRNECKGIIAEHDKDGSCSCHINPPCSYCTEPNAYCSVCNWTAQEEHDEYEKEQRFNYDRDSKYYEEQLKTFAEIRARFERKFRGEEEILEFDYITKTHTHFSMKIIGIHPKGFDLSTIMDRIRGTFGGRFVFKSDTTFEYIAYTD